MEPKTAHPRCRNSLPPRLYIGTGRDGTRPANISRW